MQFSKILLVVAGMVAAALAAPSFGDPYCHEQSDTTDCNPSPQTINCGSLSSNKDIRTCCDSWAHCPSS